MLKEQREGCGGVCSNGGQCRNGECVCRSGWEGQFCDEEEEGVAAELIWFFIIAVILVIAYLIWKQSEWLKQKLFAKQNNQPAGQLDAKEQGRLAVERDRQMREQQREEQRAARERGELSNDYLGQNRGMLLNDEDDVPQ